MILRKKKIYIYIIKYVIEISVQSIFLLGYQVRFYGHKWHKL